MSINVVVDLSHHNRMRLTGSATATAISSMAASNSCSSFGAWPRTQPAALNFNRFD